MIIFHPSCGRFIYLKLLKLAREPATVTCEWHRSGLNLEVEKASTTIIAREINASFLNKRDVSWEIDVRAKASDKLQY